MEGVEDFLVVAEGVEALGEDRIISSWPSS